jgi:hypothetical protein
MKKSIRIACPILILALLSGCNSLYRFQGKHEVKAQYEPKGRKMLIIPFKDPISEYFESAEGGVIAESAGDYIQKNKITPAQYGGFLPRSVQTAFEQNKAVLGDALKAVADCTDCDLVLIGQIDMLRLRDPRNVGVVRGEMILTAQLFEVTDEPKLVWAMPRKQVYYPEGREYESGVPILDIPEITLKLGMLNTAGEKIGKAFHDHLEDIE